MIVESDICLSSKLDNKKIKKIVEKLNKKNAFSLAEIFQLLSDVTRLKILQALTFEELCVCEVAVIAGISQSAASHQLRRLRDAGLVKKRRDGQKIYYNLFDKHIFDFIKIASEHIDHLKRH